MTDLVSEDVGISDFCGSRVFTDLSGVQPWVASLGPNDGIIGISSSNTSLINVPQTVEISVGLDDYPSITAETLTFQVTFTKACADATLTVPPPSTTLLSDLVYTYGATTAVSQDFSLIRQEMVSDSLLDCGDIELDWQYEKDGASTKVDFTGTVPFEVVDLSNTESFKVLTTSDLTHIGSY